MQLEAARDLARALMDAHGLKRWAFRFNRRKRNCGMCHYKLKTLELAAPYVQLNEEAEVRETILHEIAHAIVGPKHGHDEVWKAQAQTLGITPTRCAGPTARFPAGRYQAVCAGCRQTFSRHRPPRRRATYWCTACGPQRGLLRYHDTLAIAARDLAG